MCMNKNETIIVQKKTDKMFSIKFQSILFREFRNNQYYKLAFVIGDPLKIYYLFVISFVVCVSVCVCCFTTVYFYFLMCIFFFLFHFLILSIVVFYLFFCFVLFC